MSCVKFSDSFSQALGKYVEDPGCLHGSYWSMVIDWILGCIRDNKNIDALLSENADLLDFGIYSEISGPADPLRASILDEDLAGYPLSVLTFTEWFTRLYSRVMQCDRKEILEKEIQCVEIERKKLRITIQSLQRERKNRIIALIDEQTKNSKMRLIDELVQMDELMYSSMQMKKAIALGTFFSVVQKRDHFDREKQFQKETSWFNSFIDNQADTNGIIEVHRIQEKIAETYAAVIERETVIEKLVLELQGIEKKKEGISSAEVESRLRKELEYIRDLLKLAARRLRQIPCPIVSAGQKFFSYKRIKECLERIQEFDPEVFHNDRVALFGKPQVIILPGTGSAVYDWKNNSFILPFVIPGDNAIASIAMGVIDYRIDVDEDRALVQTYNQLPERKGIRSTVDLRASLTKDYITWMTSEYNGFRVLSKGVKEWFEHTIAPSRNEIFTPPEYQTFVLSPKEFEERVREIEESLALPSEMPDEKILWEGSILLYQRGKFAVSLELLNTLLKLNPDFTIAWYNAGLVASKLMRKQEAIVSFTEYTTRQPQSWWARIARNHLRKLQTG